MRDRFNPMIFGAIYAFVTPLALSVLALWHPLSTTGIARLHRWQEMAAAVLAALLGGAFVLFQVWHSGADARRQKLARYRALRAALVFPLDELSGYAEACAEALMDIHAAVRSPLPGGIGAAPILPPMPSGAVAALTAYVEFAPERTIGTIAALLSSLQIQNSRVGHLRERSIHGSIRRSTLIEIEGYLIDAAKLYARVQALFPYARFETDETPAPLTWADVVTSLRLLRIREPEFAAVHRTVRAYIERGTAPR